MLGKRIEAETCEAQDCPRTWSPGLPKNLVSGTANSHLPRPIVRPWAGHSSRMSGRC